MGSDTGAAKLSLENLINGNPAWSTLDAVKEERIFIMDKTLFNLKPNDRWAESYEILYEKLKKK
jgi:iron complex transport system substrate-binding protein